MDREPTTSQDDTKDILMAKGMVLTLGLFVVAVPILLVAIMVRSFFASGTAADNERPPRQQAPASQVEPESPGELGG